MAHIFDVGTRAWQPDTAEGWVASEVTDKQVAGDKVTLIFTLENGEVRANIKHHPTCTTTTRGMTLLTLLVSIRPRRSRPPSPPLKAAMTRICHR